MSILDELIVPTPSYRVRRTATLAMAQENMPSAPEHSQEKSVESAAEASARVREIASEAIAEIMAENSSEEDKQEAIASINSALARKLDRFSQMPEPTAEQKIEPKKMNDRHIFSPEESAVLRENLNNMVAAGGEVVDLPGGEVVYGVEKDAQGNITKTKGVIPAQKLESVAQEKASIEEKLKAARASGDADTTRVLEKRLREHHIFEREQRQKERRTQERRDGDRRIVDAAPTTEEKQDQQDQERAMNEGMTGVTTLGNETIYQPAKKTEAIKEEIPANHQLLEDRMEAYGGGMSKGIGAGIQEKPKQPSHQEQEAYQEQLRKDAERNEQEERARREDINYKSSVTRDHTAALKEDAERSQKKDETPVEFGGKTEEFVITPEIQKARDDADLKNLRDKTEQVEGQFRTAVEQGLYKTDPKQFELAKDAASKARNEYSAALEAREAPVYVGPMTIPAEEAPAPKEKAPQKPGLISGFIRDLWENSHTKFEADSLYDNVLAKMYDTILTTRENDIQWAVKAYEENKKKADELDAKAAAEPYKPALLRQAQKARMKEQESKEKYKKLDQFLTKYEKLRKNRCDAIAARIEVRLTPYEEKVQDCQELAKDAQHMLKLWEQRHQELSKQLADAEAEAQRTSKLFGLIVDPAVRARIDAIKQQLLAIRTQMSGRMQYMETMQSRIQRADAKAGQWRTRKVAMTQFGRANTRPKFS